MFVSWLYNFLGDWYVSDTISGKNDIAWFGNFGSFVGGLTSSAFGAIAFLGVLFSLRRQDIESKKSDEARRKSEELINLQIQNSQIQQFETSFFALLGNHDKSLKEITSIARRTFSCNKRSRFGPVNGTWTDESQYFSISRDVSYEVIQKGCNSKGLGYLNFYIELKSYFIVLYQLLKFISKSSLFIKNEDEKLQWERQYSSLIRANIPNDVLVLVMYNCCIGDFCKPYGEYKALVERYQLFEHLVFKVDDEYIDGFEPLKKTEEIRVIHSSKFDPFGTDFIKLISIFSRDAFGKTNFILDFDGIVETIKCKIVYEMNATLELVNIPDDGTLNPSDHEKLFLKLKPVWELLNSTNPKKWCLQNPNYTDIYNAALKMKREKPLFNTAPNSLLNLALNNFWQNFDI